MCLLVFKSVSGCVCLLVCKSVTGCVCLLVCKSDYRITATVLTKSTRYFSYVFIDIARGAVKLFGSIDFKKCYYVV